MVQVPPGAIAVDQQNSSLQNQPTSQPQSVSQPTLPAQATLPTQPTLPNQPFQVLSSFPNGVNSPLQPTMVGGQPGLGQGFQLAVAPQQTMVRPPSFPVNQGFGQQLVTLPGGQQAIVRCAMPQMVQVYLKKYYF